MEEMNEDNKVTLSICVVTMNRQEQLIEALESCLSCRLPKKYEIIVLDNASTDNTKAAIDDFQSKHCATTLRYFYSSHNLGVGGGRTFVFEKAQGKYLYFLDDDAVIDPANTNEFFLNTIDYLNENKMVASLTTQIHDTIFGDTRTELMSSIEYNGKKKAFFYLGGSHFLRKECFESPLYYDIQYGSEEYAPSIKAIDKGYINVYDSTIAIIHQPKVNKWVDGTERMRTIQIRCAATVYATKKILYPAIFYPLIWMGYTIRCKKYLAKYPEARVDANKMVSDIIKNNKQEKVKVSTVIRMYRDFGMTVF